MRATDQHEKAAVAFAAQDAVVRRKKAAKDAFDGALARFPPNAPLSILGQQVPLTAKIREILTDAVDHDLFLEMQKRQELSEALAKVATK